MYDTTLDPEGEFAQTPDAPPEKNLIAAILDRAIKDYLITSCDIQHHQQREVLGWFRSRSKEAFSFLWCLQALDIHFTLADIRARRDFFLTNHSQYKFRKLPQYQKNYKLRNTESVEAALAIKRGQLGVDLISSPKVKAA